MTPDTRSDLAWAALAAAFELATLTGLAIVAVRLIRKAHHD